MTAAMAGGAAAVEDEMAEGFDTPAPPPGRRAPAPFARVIGLTALVCAPTAVAFIVMVLAGQLRVVPAMLWGVLIFAATAFLVRLFATDFYTAVSYIRRLVAEATPSPPAAPRLHWSEPARDVTAAAGQLARHWAGRWQKAEASARSTEAVLDSLPQPLFMVGADRRITWANDAARRFAGREARDTNLATVLRAPDVLEAVGEVMAGGAGRQLQFTQSAPSGRTFTLVVEPLPAPAADGSRVLLVLNDITTLVRMEEMRADFVANASHELRTPLASLLGFIETLRGPARDDTEARDRFLVIMQDQAERMRRLIEDLLSLSRIELHEHTPPTGTADVREILTRTVEGLEPQAHKKAMTVRLHVPDTIPAVPGERDELAQVFQNLLANALKYGREDTTVDVTAVVVPRGPANMPATSRGPCLRVSVRDRGEGIAKEHLPRLTERFYRVDTARSRKLGGTGLGLAIVKHIVARHRGALTIDSTVGEGSTFTVHLPLQAPGGPGTAS
ncbi:ATP-binding protein [Caenispirillum bisanense]|uniref:histidine kinase n=1 Tax=Caenispirillum bisanense TaxID=414052 RepID=A0A286GU24_9PROT|nr:ATP-binding protein [Caenispirillum bisanense]SOD99067.1 two-component system, OmpR family, phosphate regulon sensor histidine kinase PhoR [Caenispirillum bisanense]